MTTVTPGSGRIERTTPQLPRFGAWVPNKLHRAIMAVTTRLPAGWLGLRLSIALRRLVTMPSGKRPFDVVRYGMRMRLYPLDSIGEKLVLFTPQMFEQDERVELGLEIDRVKIRGQTFNFVDIGANVGLISLFAASHAGPQARILAIEPEPGNFARLSFNIAANAGVAIQPIQLALAEGPGELALRVQPVQLRRSPHAQSERGERRPSAGSVLFPCCSSCKTTRSSGSMRSRSMSKASSTRSCCHSSATRHAPCGDTSS